MLPPGRALIHALLRRSSIAFMLLVTTLLVATWLLIEDGTHGLRQAALAQATQASARAALAVKDELHPAEARLLQVQREGRPGPGVALVPLPPDVTATLAGAEPGQLRFWPLPRGGDAPPEVLAFLVPAQPGAATPMLRMSVARLEALLAPPPGMGLRLVTGLGTELAAAGTPGDVHASLWVREGALRLDAGATPARMSLAVLLIPLFGLCTLGFIFRRHLQRTDRVELKLTALRASLARHAAQLSVNEARMRLSQNERIAAERRQQALIEAWPAPVALLDPEGRLIAWNAGFEALLPPETLRRDLPSGLLTRHVDLRAAGQDNGRRGPGNRPRVRATRMADGGRVLEALPDAPATGLDAARRLCRDEMLALAPQLRAAVRQGDGAGARRQAHAIRGLAANFGLSALVPALLALEAAAALPERDGIEAALAAFDGELDAALRQLGGAPA